MSLTVKQENFCTAYIETGNASEAYRRAYDAENMKPATVNRKAVELLDNGKITARLGQLRAGHAERHNVTVDTISDALDEDRMLAHRNGQAGAAVSASMGKAKLHGLITDKQEVKVGPSLLDMFNALEARETAQDEDEADPTQPDPDAIH